MIIYNDLKYTNTKYKVCKGPIDKDIEEVVFHKNTEVIKDKAFASCTNIKKIILDNIIVGANAFSFCTGLEHVEARNLRDYSILKADVFSNCGTDTANGMDIILDDIVCIRSGVFSHSKIHNISFPYLTSLDNYAFIGAVFTNPVLVLPEGFKFLCGSAFKDSNLEHLYLPDSCEYFTGIDNLDGACLHMSKKVFNKLRLKPADNIIISDISLDNLLENHTYREINELKLKETNITK